MIRDISSPSRHSGAALIAAAALLWSTAGIASTSLFAHVHPLTVGFWRVALAVPALLILARTLGRWRPLTRRAAVLLALIGLTQAGYQGFYFLGVSELGAGRATLVALCGAPVLISVIGAVVLKDRPGALEWAAVPIAVIGAALLIGAPAPGAEGSVLGYAAAGAAALSYAVFALTARELAGLYHPFQVTAIGFGVAALMLLPFAIGNGLVPGEGWGTLAYLGLVPTALAYALFFFGMRTVTATASGVLVLLEPAGAAILAALLLGERYGALGLAGGGLLLGAVLMVNLAKR